MSQELGYGKNAGIQAEITPLDCTGRYQVLKLQKLARNHEMAELGPQSSYNLVHIPSFPTPIPRYCNGVCHLQIWSYLGLGPNTARAGDMESSPMLPGNGQIESLVLLQAHKCGFISTCSVLFVERSYYVTACKWPS